MLAKERVLGAVSMVEGRETRSPETGSRERRSSTADAKIADQAERNLDPEAHARRSERMEATPRT